MEELWLIRPILPIMFSRKAMLIKYSREEKRIKIFLAIVTSGTVISIFSSYPIIWKTLSVISALLAIITTL
jgi:hypothetical protein